MQRREVVQSTGLTVSAGETVAAAGPRRRVPHLDSCIIATGSREQPYEDAVVGHRAAAAARSIDSSMRERHRGDWNGAAETVEHTWPEVIACIGS